MRHRPDYGESMFARNHGKGKGNKKKNKAGAYYDSPHPNQPYGSSRHRRINVRPESWQG
jgi:hypothetical protein